MTVSYDILVQGNSLKLADGFLGISTITLLHTANGPMLVDVGGYNTRLALLDGLKAHGLTPSDIKLIVLSHLHFDHAHNIDLFPNAKFVLSRDEWDYAESPHKGDLFMPWGIRDYLAARPNELIGSGGSVAPGVDLFPAPGHTPGLIAAEFDHTDRGRVVVACDAIKYAREALEARCDMEFDPQKRGTATIRHILDR
ncbi:MAG: MBL fold metallo-hydrolase, partial [Pseudomonadota bacterium]